MSTSKTDIMTRRTTADGKTVLFWTDGLITFGMGIRVRGVGVSKNPTEQQFNIAAAWLLAGEVSLYDAYELPALVAAARKAVRASVVPLSEFRRLANRGRCNPSATGRMDPAIAEGQRQAIESCGTFTAKKYRGGIA